MWMRWACMVTARGTCNVMWCDVQSMMHEMLCDKLRCWATHCNLLYRAVMYCNVMCCAMAYTISLCMYAGMYACMHVMYVPGVHGPLFSSGPLLVRLDYWIGGIVGCRPFSQCREGLLAPSMWPRNSVCWSRLAKQQVCMYACMHVCMYARMYVCMCPFAWACDVGIAGTLEGSLAQSSLLRSGIRFLATTVATSSQRLRKSLGNKCM